MSKRAFDMAGFYQALGDKTRLRLLNLMGDQQVCVCYFVQVLGEPQPKVSRHLAYLRRAGVVAARREGTWMHYRIAQPQHQGAAKVLQETLLWMSQDRVMQAERGRLLRVCCAPHKYEVLRGAPVPVRADAMVTYG